MIYPLNSPFPSSPVKTSLSPPSQSCLMIDNIYTHSSNSINKLTVNEVLGKYVIDFHLHSSSLSNVFSKWDGTLRTKKLCPKGMNADKMSGSKDRSVGSNEDTLEWDIGDSLNHVMTLTGKIQPSRETFATESRSKSPFLNISFTHQICSGCPLQPQLHVKCPVEETHPYKKLLLPGWEESLQCLTKPSHGSPAV